MEYDYKKCVDLQLLEKLNEAFRTRCYVQIFADGSFTVCREATSRTESLLACRGRDGSISDTLRSLLPPTPEEDLQWVEEHFAWGKCATDEVRERFERIRKALKKEGAA